MKTRTTIGLVALFCAGLTGGYWLGYQHARIHIDRTLHEAAPPTNTPTAWEEKTVVTTNDLRQQMSQWQREGWMVLSLSAPVTQKDGTISRTAHVKRAKQ